MKNVQDQSNSVIQRTLINKSTILRRIPLALIMIYYLWILIFAWLMQNSWWWDLERGLMWSSSNPGQFFPIPKPPGHEMMITLAYPNDQNFYLVFIHNGFWIIWIFLGFLFLSPYRINLHMLFISIKTKLGFRRIA